MKKFTKKHNSVAVIILVALVFLFINSVMTKEIRSTKVGGNWCEPSTWVSGEIPAENDNVIIDGEVLVNCPAFADSLLLNPTANLIISSNDSLQCHYVRFIEIDGKKGNIKNNGIITVKEKQTEEEKVEF